MTAEYRRPSPGYRAWAVLLGEQYEAAGRAEDAISIYEAAWVATSGYLARFPNDAASQFQDRGAGLMLARAYRRHKRLDDANSLEAKCKNIGT